MLYLNRDLAGSIQMPILISDTEGNVLFKNKYADFFAGRFSVPSISRVNDLLEMKWMRWDPAVAAHKQTACVSGMQLNVYCCAFEFEGVPAWIFFIEDKLMSLGIDVLLNHLFHSVLILGDGDCIEFRSDNLWDIIKIDAASTGTRISYHVERGVIKESLTSQILNIKKPMSKYVEYAGGVTAMVSGNPILNKDGSIEKIVVTVHDISELAETQRMLQEAEKEKERYKKSLISTRQIYDLTQVGFDSAQMKTALSTAERVAGGTAPVFIYGETGVGKEVIARFIHQNSALRDKPFCAVNCSAVPESLFESEFFGYEDGAFTGARKGGKSGLLEMANGGTFFLDEIGDMPYALQSKLLRAIQEKIITRIGGTKIIPINIRFIAATNLARQELLAGAKLRRDLFYRLAVIPIYIPPLRERREDIPPLVKYYLQNFNDQYKKQVAISEQTLKRLVAYDWPGNIRELRNLIERIVILSESNSKSQIEEDFIYGSLNMIPNNDSPYIETIPESGTLLKDILQRVERDSIIKMCRKEGTIIRAARKLGIAPSTIYRKIARGELPSEQLLLHDAT